jgi:prophage regulatory protein
MSMHVLLLWGGEQALALRLQCQSAVIHGMSNNTVNHMKNNQTTPAHHETAPDFELCAADLATVIKLPQLTKMVAQCKSMVYLKINPKSRYFDKNFPQPIRLGPNSIGWLLSDVLIYIRSLKKNESLKKGGIK